MYCILVILMHYIIYVGYGHWHNTGTAYKVIGGSVQVNASLSL